MRRWFKKIDSPSVVVAFMSFSLVACNPGFEASSEFLSANQTGFTASDGKTHTGAAVDNELEKLKAQLAGDTSSPQAISSKDRDLASRILYASLETVDGKDVRRVYLSLRESGGVYFDFKPSDRTTAATGDTGLDTRYKFVTGRLASDETTSFEVALLCRKTSEECGVATLSLREKKKGGAKAGLVVRHQNVMVQSKSTKTGATHPVLRRLTDDLKVAKAGKLQSFEVAWGPSGFSVDIGDSQICPSGRLVETNDLDEPIKLNCPTVPLFRDIEGRMIGNSTRGEIFIEISRPATNAFGSTNESVYILVRRQKAAALSPGQTTASPEDDDSDEALFDDEVPTQTDGATPGTTAPTGLTGWLVPVDLGHKMTKVWARDRKHPVIEKGVEEWKKSTRLKRFAVRFLPNREMILQKLSKHQVPNEFALITLIESTFFIQDGYPVQTSSASAVGPWQFMPRTGKGNGLTVFPRVKSGNKLLVHACDERADLEKSSEAAGRYLSSIMKMFPHDPKLVLMGYNQGEHGVQRNFNILKNTTSEARLKVVREVGLNYWALRKFNMAPGETLRYVEKFVSAYHAALEMEPIAADPSIAPWKPTGACSP